MRDKIFVQNYLVQHGHSRADKHLVRIDKLVTLPPKHYIEGVLLLTVNDVALITREMWDDLDCLWAYWVNAIEELITASKTTFGFPDQAIEVSMEKIGREKLRVKVHGRSVVVDRKTFCVTMLEHAARTFDKLVELHKDKWVFLQEAVRARTILQQYVDGSGSK